MKEGSVILVSKPKKGLYNKILPPLIRWFTDCEYHHVAVVGLLDGEEYVFESVFHGFKPTKKLVEYISYIEKENIKVSYIDINPAHIQEFRVKLHEVNNTYYDFTSLFIYHPIYQLSKRLFLKSPSLKRFFKNWIIKDGLWVGAKGPKAKSRTTCSETVAYLWGEWDWEVWTAKDFYSKYKEEVKPFRF